MQALLGADPDDGEPNTITDEKSGSTKLPRIPSAQPLFHIAVQLRESIDTCFSKLSLSDAAAG